jgi:hypothetical protein
MDNSLVLVVKSIQMAGKEKDNGKMETGNVGFDNNQYIVL